MVNINKLKGRIVEHGLSIAELAKLTGIDKATLYRKISNNGDTFTIREADLIVSALKLSAADAVGIFFSQCVAQVRLLHTQKGAHHATHSTTNT